MLKTSFKLEESKQFFYCDYKNFDKEHFQMDLESELSNCPKKYENFKTTFENFLNAHVPEKTKFLQGNQKSHVYKKFCQAIMKRSRLKSKANGTKQLDDITKYKKQQNLVVTLSRKSKIQYFDNIQKFKNSKPF